MPRLDKRVTGVAKKQASIYINDRGFVEEIEETLDYLEDLPTHFEFKCHTQLQPEKMGPDPNQVFLNLLKDLHGWLGFTIFSNTYKIRHLASDIIDGLNMSNYIKVTTASRSIMEQVATLNYYYIELAPRLHSLNSIDVRQQFVDYVVSIVEVIKLLLRYAQSTRFNWASYVSGDLDKFFASWDEVEDSVRQVNILTLIDKLPQEERGARFFYEMLCDFVHPNIASHTLVVNEAAPIEGQQMFYSLAYAPDSNELLAIILHTISIPIRSSLRLSRSQIVSLRHTWEGLEGVISGIEKSL